MKANSRTNCTFHVGWIIRHGVSAAALIWAGIFGTAFAAPGRQPNFVLVLSEGHGWSSTSVQMDDAVPQSKSALVRTPNFEKLAESGMRFANFYAPSPRCTPSRAALLTGKSPAQLHMTFVGEGRKDTGGSAGGRVLPPLSSTELPTGETTVASLLKRAGYATAHFGKWHLGRIDPHQYGFDASDGPTNNGGPDNVDNPHPKQLFGMPQRGLDFMARQVKAGKPFYLQLSHYASRHGGDARPESAAAVKRWGDRNDRDRGIAAADLDLDVAFGMLLKKLDELGIASNTYVIFTADHGSPGRNTPLAGGKGTVWDGGLRVPFIIRGPGIKAGTSSRVRAIGEDLFPTIAELALVTGPLPKGIEGGSLVSVLTGAGKGAIERPHEAFVVHFPHYDKDEQGPASTILLDNYKVIRVYETGRRRLFDLSKDIGERNDLAQAMPEKVKELDHRLSDYLAAVHAQMPTQNPNYDPSQTLQSSPQDQPKKGKGLGKKVGGKGGDRHDKQDRPGSAGTKREQPAKGEFRTSVPEHPFDIVLTRPTPSSITASVLFYHDAEASLFWGTKSGDYSSHTPAQQFKKGEPAEIVVSRLQPDTRYFYQLRYRVTPSSPVHNAPEGSFHTARSRGHTFVFTIQADPHLDEHTEPAVYRRTLENSLADHPDFHIDLGDTFMSEKHASRETAARQYLAQRYYFGLIGQSAPVFLVLGNHDGEGSRWHDGTANSLAVWSNTMRKRYFPNPVPDEFYSGNSVRDPLAGLLEDYYAWEWGDALFVVLDPFWYTPRQRGGSGNWNWTLGTTQCQWLKQTLQQSRAAMKFVFIHHLVGGASREGRGGVEAAPFYEWGGRNADGTEEFRGHRPGWPMPIHQLMVENCVAAVFHGHDHLYVKQDLGGIVYQEVPQPGAPGRNNTRTAAEYGYKSGVILGSSGHLRVRVSPDKATVDYIRTWLPDGDRPDRHDGEVSHSYVISAKDRQKPPQALAPPGSPPNRSLRH